MKRIALLAALALFSVSAFASDPAPPLPVPVASKGLWQPKPHMRWQLQYSTTPVDLKIEADVYKIDLFDNDATAVSDLKSKGKHVVCYVNVGAWEDWRPDASRFPQAAIGKEYDGWAGERWLDIRRIDLLAPIMLARLDMCKSKGFDGVLLDNIDNYQQKTGFPLSGTDQLRYIVWIANEARTRGLAVGINNNPEQALQLLPYFDWALAESCFSHGWCASLRAVAKAGKPVVVVEYTDGDAKVNTAKANALCKQASTLKFAFMMKKRELDAFRYDCRGGGASRSAKL